MEKKKYEKPELSLYGNIEEITKGPGGTQPEGSGFQS
ncbi:MAG: lasso RiPP family leader peptide-containing protein [Methanobacterium sp.]|jgi:hypothetical protein